MSVLTATDGQAISDIEDRDIVVPSGVRLHIKGITNGSLHVLDHGEVRIDGMAKGALSVELGGRVEVTGVLGGPIVLNGGVVRLAEGAMFRGRTMGRLGFEPARSASSTITRDTPRHRIVGTHGNYGVEL